MYTYMYTRVAARVLHKTNRLRTECFCCMFGFMNPSKPSFVALIAAILMLSGCTLSGRVEPKPEAVGDEPSYTRLAARGDDAAGVLAAVGAESCGYERCLMLLYRDRVNSTTLDALAMVAGVEVASAGGWRYMVTLDTARAYSVAEVQSALIHAGLLSAELSATCVDAMVSTHATTWTGACE